MPTERKKGIIQKYRKTGITENDRKEQTRT